MIRTFLPLAIVSITVASPCFAQQQADTVEMIFARADTNHDGVVTIDEWKAIGRTERGFSFVDANHDGKITPDELRAVAARLLR